MSGEENQVEGNELAEARAEIEKLKNQIGVYGLIDDAYNALEENSEQKNWIDNNWKELTKSWAEHMLDPANLGDEYILFELYNKQQTEHGDLCHERRLD